MGKIWDLFDQSPPWDIHRIYINLIQYIYILCEKIHEAVAE